MSNKISQPIENFLFWSRWLQAPLYIGLTLIQLAFVWLFIKELWHMFATISTISEIHLILAALGLIDVIMVVNLIIMVVIGGYETFVSSLELHDHPDHPEWLEHVNASALKVKLATALISISSIHLLKTFFDTAKVDDSTIMWQIAIHLTLLLSAFMVAYTDKIMNISINLGKKHH